MRYPTIKEIASIAGVSANTVSRALRGESGVSQETTAKIRKIAGQIGYERNVLASHLRTRQNRTVGVIIIDNSNPFYAEVLKGIEAGCKLRGYQILIYNTQGDHAKEEQAIRLMFSYRARGIIIDPIPNCGESHVRLLKEKDFPFVLASHYCKDIQANWVGYDDHEVGRTLGELLISKGHSKILFFGGYPGDSTYDDRFEGFCAALRAHGLEPRPENIVNFQVDGDMAYRKMKLLVASPRRFTAIMAYNDIAALAALKAIKEEGLRVPHDIALVGVDDIAMTDLVEPGLTTMHLPKQQAGQVAAELLIDCIENHPPERRIVLKPRLVLRGSV
ncbi:MAG: LacI family DNA-binding transcriptional regulator [Bacillota bacterium]|nr:LacI family DNA-binding transcriptional regulator [Bacillota bacterium]